MTGTITAVCTSANKGPKAVVDGITLRKHHGILGDAHAGQWHRQVSLLAEVHIAAMREHIPGLELGAFGENIVIRDLAPEKLAVGQHLQVGPTVVLRITQIGKDCHRPCAIYHRVGHCIMPQYGTFAEVLTSGEIHSGDTAVALQSPLAVPRTFAPEGPVVQANRATHP